MPHKWENFHCYIEMWLYNQRSFDFLVSLWFLFLCRATQFVSLSLLSQQKTPTTKCLSSCVLFQAKAEVTLPGEGLTSLRRRLKETASAVTFSFITKMKMGKKNLLMCLGKTETNCGWGTGI